MKSRTKKILKRTLISIGIFFGSVLVLLAAAPMLLKDTIKKKVDTEVAKKIDADVRFDGKKFGLSFFRNFPNLTVSLGDFSIVGRGDFEGDTLASGKAFRLILDPFSLAGEKVKIKGVYLDSPKILAKVLKSGKANWDIYKSEPEKPEDKKEKPSEFALKIDRWEIENGTIVYDDRSADFKTVLRGVNHSGSGDFTQDIFDLETDTKIKSATAEYAGVQYLNDNRLDLDATVEVDLPKSKYTFKKNTCRINDFAFGFDGFVRMLSTGGYDTDVKVSAKETRFKNILSLVPGVFTKDFDDLKTNGTLAFDGFVKGIYDKEKMPAFGITVQVKDGMLQYPELPVPVKNIVLNADVRSPQNRMDDMFIDIRRFHMDMGTNPTDARIKIKGLKRSEIDADVKAALNLADLTKIFPTEGTSLRGIFNITGTAKGVYDSLHFPVVKAFMDLKNGYVKSKRLPAPLENVNFQADLNSPTGNAKDAKLRVENLTMLLDGEPFTAHAFIEDFSDYAYNVDAKGIIDLTKLTKIYPISGMKLAGRINADIKTKGRMSDVKAERYDKLPTSGTLSVSNFTYSSSDLPQGLKINKANLTFTPQKAVLSDMQGYLGKSDVRASGQLDNPIAYFLSKNAKLKGNLTLNSARFDANEWTGNSSKATAATSPSGVVSSGGTSATRLPQNIDFQLNSSIGEVKYDNLSLNNLKGNVILRNGTLQLDRVNFNTLGGTMALNGTYDTREEKPRFDFDVDISKMAVKEAFGAFNTVQAFAPIAKNVVGEFSTKFKIGGLLGKNMVPIFSSLRGDGLISLKDAMLTNVPFLQKVGELVKISELKNPALRDILMKADIRDGRLHVKPFDVKIGNQTMTVSGSNGIDGSMDYALLLDVPTGTAGTAAASVLAGILKQDVKGLDKVKVGFKIGGTYNNPKVGMTASAGNALKTTVEDNLDKAKQDAENKVKEEIEKKKAEAEQKLKEEQEKLQKKAEEELKKKADELKKKLGLPVDE